MSDTAATTSDGAAEALRLRVKHSFNIPGLQRTETAVVKAGPKAYKTASLLYFGPSPEQITKRELVVKTSMRSPGVGYDFADTQRDWYCQDQEIDRLAAFLRQQGVVAAGEYHLVASESPLVSLLSSLTDRGLPPAQVADVLTMISRRGDLADLLACAEGTDLLAAAVQVQRQRKVIDQLTTLVEDPTTSEGQLQTLLFDEWWIFGGRYVQRLDRRRYTGSDELDIPLLRSDGVLHIIELKKANVRGLVRKHRSHNTVGNDVNEAVNQAANYLRVFDEQGSQFAVDYKIRCRRSYTTIVIGHPMHNAIDGVSHEEVREAIRVYGSHFSRIEVLTYEDLLAGANQSIAFLREQMADGGTVVGL
jgi:hypothetical protein